MEHSYEGIWEESGGTDVLSTEGKGGGCIPFMDMAYSTRYF